MQEMYLSNAALQHLFEVRTKRLHSFVHVTDFKSIYT